MLAFVPLRQLQVFARCLLRFLDESVKQHHPVSYINVKQYPRDAILPQPSPNLVDPIAQRLASGHPNGPPELHGLDVLPNPPPVFR